MVQAEDYVHSLISVVNELVSMQYARYYRSFDFDDLYLKSRWAVNAVTLGDFERPIKISVFVKNLFAGFSMVN